jgi:hypothetical protein
MIHLVASFDFTTSGGAALPASAWTPPGAKGCWSKQRVCPVELPVPTGAGDLLLEIELDSQSQHAVVRHRRIAVDMDGTRIAERRVGGRLVWTLTAGHAGAVVRLQFTDLDYTPASPRGIRLARIKVLRNTHAPLPAPLRPMRDIRFSWNDTTEAMLGEGWGSPEDTYVWAVGPLSVLHVTVPDDGAPLLAVLDIYPYIRGATQRQRVVVAADGDIAVSLELTIRVSVAIELRPAPGQTSVRLSFRNLDADFETTDPHFHFGKPFAWFLSSLRLMPALPRYLPGQRPRLPGTLADGSMQRMAELLTGLPAAELVARFEGLGNGCELGLLQQSLGQDRSGLLRFAAVRQRELVEGLLHGFQGVARADRLEWTVRRAEDDTWRLIEKTYELSSASPHPRNRPAPDFRLESRRLPRLADKLMEDVAAGDKIFVLRISPEPATEPVALAVLAALRHFGEADMVWLVTDGAMPPGCAERLACGLVRGHLESPLTGLPVSGDAMMSALANSLVLLRQGQRLAPGKAQQGRASF